MTNLRPEVSNRSKQLGPPESGSRKLVRALLEADAFPIGGGDLSLVFVDDPEMADIHEIFMGDPSATDVITFPADPEMESAGEIIVSVDHARKRASELGTGFSRELALYLVHGWLHLAGYDDHSEKDRTRMREAEKKAMAILHPAGVDTFFQLADGA